MSAITHEQARAYIHTGQSDLNASQRSVLGEHLTGCAECREYARRQERLAAALTQTLHARWDGQLARPDNPHKISTAIRRNEIPDVSVRLASSAFLIVALVLGLVAALRWALPPVSQPGEISLRPVETEENRNETLPLQLDPTVCSEQAYPAPVGAKLPYPATQVIGGGAIQQGDFTFRIYLYCDEKLKPEDPVHYSAISGLGIIARWSYDGPKLEGEFWDLYGFEPEVRLSTGSLDLYRASAGYGGGLLLPEINGRKSQISDFAETGTPVQFLMKVQTENTLFGARLTFKLREGAHGYLPVEIRVTGLPIEPVVPQK